jgi:Zn-dependent protease/CBS domain-containing protein
MNGALIGRIRGIEIRISWSVAIIGWLIAYSLAEEVLPEMAEGLTETDYWVAGLVATIGFFVSLLAHELGHSLVAQSYGVGVKSITLWMLGGVARLEGQPQTPTAAMRIAAAGPAVSVACGVVGLVAGALGSGLAGAVLIWFGTINLILAVFNLLPAFPLDGGRIYQARLWRRGLSSEAATAKAARLGGVIGQVMVFLGAIEILFGQLLGGIWLMAIGWFVREASMAEAQMVRTESVLGRYMTSEVMTRDPESVPATLTLERFVDDALASGRHAAYPVRDVTSGQVIGLATLKAVRSVPRDQWSSTTVQSVMKPLAETAVVAPGESVSEVMRRMQEQADTRALVIDRGELVGIVSPSDIVRLSMAVELAEGIEPPA